MPEIASSVLNILRGLVCFSAVPIRKLPSGICMALVAFRFAGDGETSRSSWTIWERAHQIKALTAGPIHTEITNRAIAAGLLGRSSNGTNVHDKTVNVGMGTQVRLCVLAKTEQEGAGSALTRTEDFAENRGARGRPWLKLSLVMMGTTKLRTFGARDDTRRDS
jgi:hypothetical protein